MKRMKRLSVMFFLFATVAFGQQERIIVQASKAELETLGISGSQSTLVPNWRVFSGDSLMIGQLKEKGLYAEVDRVMRTYGLAKAGRFTLTASNLAWWLTGNGGMWPGDFKSAWRITTGDSSVKVGILDSGSPEKDGAWTSSGLDSSRFVIGPSFVTNSYGVETMPNSDYANTDYLGHSTHIEGIVAASENDSVGVVGIDHRCQIEVYKVINSFGWGYYSWVADGIYRATEDGCRIINLSLGGPWYSRMLEDAMRYATDHGVLVVAAAGNDGDEVQSFPAFFNKFSTSGKGMPGVISVGSIDMQGGMSWFSDRGFFTDVYAPGGTGHFPADSSDILSTWPSYYVFLDDTTNGKPMTENYAYLAGTSMSAPMIVGTASLMLAENPKLTAVQLKQMICSTTDTLMMSAGPVPALNPGRAVLAAKNFRPVVDVVDVQHLPLHFELSQNYPNPFNPTTTISFSLPQSEEVSLGVYNTLGQLVQSLAASRLSAGRHQVSFDGSRLASGVYFYRLETAEATVVKKMVLMK